MLPIRTLDATTASPAGSRLGAIGAKSTDADLLEIDRIAVILDEGTDSRRRPKAS
jgi:hypothetical protein